MQEESVHPFNENIAEDFNQDGLSALSNSNRSSFKKTRKKLTPSEESVDENLVAFNSGSHVAFTTIHNELYPNIYYFARRFVNSDDAVDMTSDAFMKLWKMEKKFIRIQSVKIWLQVTVRNACINHFRDTKYKRERLKELLYLSDEIVQGDIQDEETRAELIKRIDAEVQNLPPQSRRVFRMAWIEGLKNKEIACRLGISANTVKSHKQKALTTLRMEITFPLLLILFTLLIKLGFN
jgi:RNA polymerase sigma-70 factor (family 1)